MGVQRAGTTWWYGLLSQQVAIHHEPGLRKERHFFDRFFERAPTDADIETYTRWFPRPPGLLVGEWTPNYLHHFWVPPLIARWTPDAKLLVLLRDPVDRYVSGLTHEMQYGRLPRFSYADDACAMGMYGAELSRLLSLVPVSRVLVLQYERCRADPRGQLKRTLEFLDIGDEPGPVPPQRVNETVGQKVNLPGHVREELAARYAQDLRQLVELVPHVDLELWPGVTSAR